MSKVIGVMIDGEETWHAKNESGTDYATICGIDPDDDSIGHEGVIETNKVHKITCQQCYSVWKGIVSLKLRESSFDVEHTD